MGPPSQRACSDRDGATRFALCTRTKLVACIADQWQRMPCVCTHAMPCQCAPIRTGTHTRHKSLNLLRNGCLQDAAPTGNVWMAVAGT